MKKLRLDPDDLAVEAFDTVGEGEDGSGTVRGHQESNRFPVCGTLAPQATTCETGPTCPECAYTLDPCTEETLVC